MVQAAVRPPSCLAKRTGRKSAGKPAARAASAGCVQDPLNRPSPDPGPGAIPDRKRFPGHPAFHEKHTIFKPGHCRIPNPVDEVTTAPA